jgi:selenocysteine lyase/cysteine desulfurase
MFKPSSVTDITTIRERIAGIRQHVPLFNGETRTYINLDNAASTPALLDVIETVEELMRWYAGAHGGSGIKSRITAQACETARAIVAHFVGANPREYAVRFVPDTRAAIHNLTQQLALDAHAVVLAWLPNAIDQFGAAEVIHIANNASGELDEAELDRKLAHYADRVKLLAIGAVSPITGALPPIHHLAEKAHAAGAHILVDATALAAHRPLSIGALDDVAHIDYIVVSGRTLYAPFGSGALIARRDTCEPDPECDATNVTGAVALAAAIRTLEALGLSTIADHESQLTAYALGRLRAVDGIRIYGDPRPESTAHRLGIIPINLNDMPPGLIAAILSAEFGIGARSNRSDHNLPDHLHISFGMYNSAEEVDVLIDALQRIARGRYYGRYQPDVDGEYRCVDWKPDLGRYFHI